METTYDNNQRFIRSFFPPGQVLEPGETLRRAGWYPYNFYFTWKDGRTHKVEPMTKWKQYATLIRTGEILFFDKSWKEA